MELDIPCHPRSVRFFNENVKHFRIFFTAGPHVPHDSSILERPVVSLNWALQRLDLKPGCFRVVLPSRMWEEVATAAKVISKEFCLIVWTQKIRFVYRLLLDAPATFTARSFGYFCLISCSVSDACRQA